MKKLFLAASVAALCSTNVNADVIGLYAGAQVWDNEAAGAFGENGDLATFNFSDEQQASYYVAVEHPLPFIPNAKVSQTTLDTSGGATLTSDFDFGDQVFPVNSIVDTTVDLSYTDYTLYYELFDNGLFTFDFGITARDVDADIQVMSQVTSTDDEGNSVTSALSGDLSVSEFIPMLYASTIIGLPFTGFNLFAEGNFLSIDDNILYDYQAGISYELVDNIAVDVNLTAGYRSMLLELEDVSDLYTDIEFKGVFAGVVVHF
jgi:outer membrane protein